MDDRDVTWLLVVVLIISVAVLVVPRWLRNPRAGLWIAGVAASLVLAWNVSGEISASNGTNNFSQVLLGNFPSPRTGSTRRPDRSRRSTSASGSPTRRGSG